MLLQIKIISTSYLFCIYNLCPDFEGLIQQKIIYSISAIAAVVTKSVS